MKALILAAGRGKRLSNTYDQSKCLLSVRSKPLIEYSFDSAISTAVSELIVVVGHKADEIMGRYGTNYRGKTIRYAMQPKQEGLVHAIETARDWINGEDFLLLLGDEIMLNPRHGSMIHQFRTENLFGICGGLIEKRRERISKTYAIIQDEANRICRLIEKPRRPPNEWMGTGSCVFKNEIYSYISRTPVNPNRGEKELPDLIQCAVDEGEKVKSFLVCDRYFNVNAPDDLQEAQHGLVVLTTVGTQ